MTRRDKIIKWLIHRLIKLMSSYRVEEFKGDVKIKEYEKGKRA